MMIDQLSWALFGKDILFKRESNCKLMQKHYENIWDVVEKKCQDYTPLYQTFMEPNKPYWFVEVLLPLQITSTDKS